MLHFWRDANYDRVLLNTPPNTTMVQTQSTPGQSTNYTYGFDEASTIAKLRIDTPNVPSLTDAEFCNCKDAFKRLPLEGSIIVLQTEEQRNLWRKYGKFACYLDSTHGVNQFDFPLLSLVVEDVYGMGRVVASCICTSTGAVYIEAFLEAIKNASPDIEPKFIVTDDDNAEWCAVQKVFPSTLRLLCQFHVLIN